MLTITISRRAVLLAALLVIGGLAAFYTSEARGSAPDSILQGDTDCDGSVDGTDALNVLRHAGGLPVGPFGGCPEVGTLAAIPGPPGITHFAHVTYEGEVEAGTATAADNTSTGTYHVTFPVSVNGCVAVANPGPSGAGTHRTDANAVILMPGSASDTLIVEFYVPDGSAVNTDFHVILVC